MGKKETRRKYLSKKYFGCHVNRVTNRVFLHAVEKFLIDHDYLKKDEKQMHIPGLQFAELRAAGFIQMVLDFEENLGDR